MDVPSSPPIAHDIPSSPPLLPQAFRDRKRPLSAYDNLSSDPLFSEDASDRESHSGARRKRQYRGPWWAHGRPEHGSRQASKCADSGVWMASEGSEDSLESLPPRNDTTHIPAVEDVQTKSIGRSPSKPTSRETPDITNTPEALAARIVLDCVERGDESIDISDMSLGTLPAHVVQPLKQLILAKAIDDLNPDTGSDNFAAWTPDLKVFLSKNDLKSVPETLWELDNLAVLSLRHNSLTELSEGVGKLKKLRELNIAGNAIAWLPWELLHLIVNRQGEVLRLTTHPNPLCSPVDATVLAAQQPVSFKEPALVAQSHQHAVSRAYAGDRTSETTLSVMIHRVANAWRSHLAVSPNDNMVPVYAASSTISYFEINGQPCRSAPDATGIDPTGTWLADLGSGPISSGVTSRAPPLFDLTAKKLHSCSFILPGVLKANPGLDGPVLDAIRSALERTLADLPRCSVCSRTYVFKRAEWVEYWHCNMSTNAVPSHLLFLPFMRRACSWGCVERAWEDRRD